MSLLVLTVLLLFVSPLARATCNVNVTTGFQTLSVETINNILAIHNKARITTVPLARVMPMLQWDTDLAQGAQTYLDQCSGFKHSTHTYRTNKAGFQYVGENLAAGFDVNHNGMEVAVEKWIEERQAWVFEQNCDTKSAVCGKCSPSGSITSCGHYTLAVWNMTTHVGCAYKECSDTFKHYYACWYGPGGNIGGRAPFAAGTPVAECQLSIPSDAPPTTSPSTTSSASSSTPTPPAVSSNAAPTSTPAPSQQQQQTTAIPPPTPSASPPPGGGGGATPNGSADDDGGSSSIGIIIGVVVGVLVVVVIIGLVIFFVMRSKKSNNQTTLSQERGGKNSSSLDTPMMEHQSSNPVETRPRMETLPTTSSGPDADDDILMPSLVPSRTTPAANTSSTSATKPAVRRMSQIEL